MSEHDADEGAAPAGGVPGLVSICIPVYNKAGHLAKVLEGILTQPYPHIEVLISDNGSDDGSSDIAREFARGDARIRYHHIERTISLNENWRLVMRLATGEFRKMHSADDALHPDFLPRMVEPMLKDPAIDFTVCRENARFHDVAGKIDMQTWIAYFKASGDLCRELTMLPEKRTRARLLVERSSVRNYLGNIYKILWRQRCIPTERWKQLSASYPMPQSFADWDFLLRLFLDHRGFFVDQELAWFDFDQQSPFVKLQTNPQMQLAANIQDYFMPLTVLTDPTLAAMREWISPQNREQLYTFMSQRLRTIAASALNLDAANCPAPPATPRP